MKSTIPFNIYNMICFIKLQSDIDKIKITKRETQIFEELEKRGYKMKDLQTEYLYEIGYSCKRWRISMDYTLEDVANDLGYSVATVSCFERGKTNNCIILFWYLAHGFNPDKRMVDPDNNKVFISAGEAFWRILKG